MGGHARRGRRDGARSPSGAGTGPRDRRARRPVGVERRAGILPRRASGPGVRARSPLTSPAVAVATMTLEIGIDIGTVDYVLLTSPPPSVSSLLQRIGRGNRRGAESRVGYAADRESWTGHDLAGATYRNDAADEHGGSPALPRRHGEAPGTGPRARVRCGSWL
ncbi:MAG: hypothetical protein HYV07_07405 [Deltaproteobacteria bacterium]|nr:hypothetical protein [Deltaproteobacteria bacterium]